MRPADFARRIRALRIALARQELDGLLVTHEANVRYLCGFPGHDTSLLITRRGAWLITDSRYIQEAEDLCGAYLTVTLAKHSTFEAIDTIARRSKIRTLGFEAMHLPYGVATRLKKYCAGARLKTATGLVEEIRSIKDAGEIRAIRRSIAVTRRVFERAVSLITPGVSEHAIAERIELLFLKAGTRPSFPAIVASGANTSKPHAAPGHTKIRPDSFVMIDMGCIDGGYCSDLTRMVILGAVDKQFRRIYHIVQAAQELAIAAVRPGARIAEIDRTARAHIEQSGFGRYFAHALGHGVGVEIHEQPTVTLRNEGTIEAGMVFTIEPGIYIPGFGGVRIEDMVLVTKTGCEVLTR